MGSEVATAFVGLMPSTKGFGAATERQIGPQMNGAAKRSGSRFGRVFASSTMGPLRALGAAALGLFAVKKVKDFFGSALGEAREAQKVSALTAQVIKTTGGAANVSAKQVGRLAGSISNKTAIDDEAIQSGLNLLLTFKDVRNEAGRGNKIFNQAGKAAVDMAAAMAAASGGQVNLKAATNLVGKALNDPIKGLSALSKNGVTFTEGQKKVIGSLVKQGKTAAAQKIILRELKSEFGGAAASQASAADKAKVAWGNLKEQIGGFLLPVVDRLATVFTSKVVPAVSTFVAQIQSGQGAGGRFASVLSQIGAVLTTVFTFVNNNRTVVATFVGVIVAWTAAQAALNLVLAANPLGLIVIALAALVAGVVYAYQNFRTFRVVVDAVFGFLRAAVSATIGFVRDHWKLIGTILLGPLFLVGVQVVKHWGKIKAAIVGGVSTVIGFVRNNWQAILATLIAGPVGLAVALVVKHWGSIKKAFSGGVDRAVGFVKALPGRLTGAIPAPLTLLSGIGGFIVQGLRNGISAAGHLVESAVTAIVNKIPKKIRQIMRIESPSKVTKELGKHITHGLAVGIEGGGPRLVSALQSQMKKILDHLDKQRDKVKGRVDDLKSQFGSIKDSVAGAFTGDLFNFDSESKKSVGTQFRANLVSAAGNLTGLKAAFAKLRGWGVDPSFLATLFSAGQSGLILELAGGTQASALSDASLFGQVQGLSNSLGTSVADEVLGSRIDQTNAELAAMNKNIKAVAKDLAAEINKAAAAAGKKGKKS